MSVKKALPCFTTSRRAAYAERPTLAMRHSIPYRRDAGGEAEDAKCDADDDPGDGLWQ
jgi:hypothetical protein